MQLFVGFVLALSSIGAILRGVQHLVHHSAQRIGASRSPGSLTRIKFYFLKRINNRLFIRTVHLVCKQFILFCFNTCTLKWPMAGFWLCPIIEYWCICTWRLVVVHCSWERYYPLDFTWEPFSFFLTFLSWPADGNRGLWWGEQVPLGLRGSIIVSIIVSAPEANNANCVKHIV